MSDEAQLHARVLSVEDNPVNQAVVSGMLQRLGCETDLAGDGLEAIGALSDASYDLILMDCEMPGMDGFEATRIIRQRERERNSQSEAVHIPILAVTAYVLEYGRDDCLAAGMDDYMSKPFSIEQLFAVLRRWLPFQPDQSPTLFELPELEDRTFPTAFRKEGSPDIDAQGISTYLRESTELIESLRQAIVRHDISAVQSGAHSLKSQCATRGAVKLADLCEELEQIARAGRVECVPEHLARVAAENDAVKVALRLRSWRRI